MFRAGSGSGKVLVSRGCCRGCARVSNASPRSMCLPGNRSTAGRSATGITKTVGQRGVGALGVAVAGYQRQLARCFVVHSDAAHSARAAPSRMSTSNTALKSLCRALLCSLREDLKSKVTDLSARSPGSAGIRSRTTPRSSTTEEQVVPRPMACSPVGAPRNATRGLRSGGRRGCCQ